MKQQETNVTAIVPPPIDPPSTPTYRYEQNYAQAETGSNPSVNLAIGRLRHTFTDLSVGHNSYAVGVSHVYNSKLSSAFADMDFGVGKGWKLNLHQCVVSAGTNSEGKSIVKYLDELGETHTFVNYAGNSYYDERNAQTVLTYTSTQKYITDSIGNKLVFDTNGMLIRSESYHTTPIVKQFVYNADNRLTEIYDTRTSVSGGKAVNRINLIYDANTKLLSNINLYVNNSLQQALYYFYTTNGCLSSMRKVGFNASGASTASKTLREFQYNSSAYLTNITDSLTREAYKISYYSSSRVSKLENCVNVGGSFTVKSYNSYVYTMLSESDEVCYQVDVTDKNGISIAYCISRDARVVSSFEKVSTTVLKTLNKQGEKRSLKFDNEVSTPSINGKKSRLITDGTFEVALNGLDISRSKLDQSNINYNYSFWARHESTCKRLDAEATYIYTSGTSTTKKVRLDSKATCAWQRVDIPITLNKDKDGNPDPTSISKITVKFVVNGVSGVGVYYINEIGFAPGSSSTMLLANSSNSIVKPLSDVTSITTNLGTITTNNRTDANNYMTENDIIATFAQKYLYYTSAGPTQYFDVIYNNGTKRMGGNLYDLSINFADGTYMSKTNTSPFAVETLMPMPNMTVYTLYDYSGRQLTVTNFATKNNTTSTTSSTVDRYGKKLKETDEYDVSVVYTYDSIGNLTKRQLQDAKGNIGAEETYTYDTVDRTKDQTSGLSGQRFEYNQSDMLEKLRETNYTKSSISYALTGRYNSISYDSFKDYPTQIYSYYGSTYTSNQLGYANGRARTVTNGSAKYGAQYDLANDSVSYTVFNGSTEKLVQKTQLTEGSTGVKTVTNFYYDSNGNQIDGTSTSVDKYGRSTSSSHTKGNVTTTTTTYTYGSQDESSFVVQPLKRHDFLTKCDTKFNYDTSGNLFGWETTADSNSGMRDVSVKQVSNCMTKFSFGKKDNEEYFIQTLYDPEKTFAPRVVGTVLYKDGSGWLDFKNRYDKPTTVFKQEQSYDSLGRLKTKGLTEYTYDKVGNHSVVKTEHTTNYNPEIDSHITYDYDEWANVKQIKHEFKWQYGLPGYIGTVVNVPLTSFTRDYTYDSMHRVISEKIPSMNVDRTYTYTNGRLSKITDNKDSSKSRTFKYSNGLLSQAGNFTYQTDHFGNRAYKLDSKIVSTYSYEKGNKLVKVNGNIIYQYNSDGVRFKKTVDGKTTIYYLDGDKIIGEDLPDGTILRYFYDDKGIAYAKHGNSYYRYIRDSLGNVVMILDEGDRVVARYEYDMFGNCVVYNASNVVVNYDSNMFAKVNPFRWKGYYYDAETGFYYVNGRYYDPETASYLDATSLSTVFDNVFDTDSLDRDRVLCDNLIALLSIAYTFCLSDDLSPDPNYDAYGLLPWWTKVEYWFYEKINQNPGSSQWWQWLILGVVAVLAVVALVIGTVCTFGLSGTVMAATGAAFLLGAGGNLLGQAIENNFDFSKIDPMKSLKVGGCLALISGLSVLFCGLLGELGIIYGSELGAGLARYSINGISVARVFGGAEWITAAGGYIGKAVGIIGGSMMAEKIGNIIFGNDVSITELIANGFVGLMPNLNELQWIFDILQTLGDEPWTKLKRKLWPR